MTISAAMERREETRKASSTILSVQPVDGVGVPEETLTIVEVPVEVVNEVEVPVIEEVVVDRFVTKQEVEYVDKEVIVPTIQFIDRAIEVPIKEEIIRKVFKKEIVDVPKYVIKEVPVFKVREIPAEPAEPEEPQTPIQEVVQLEPEQMSVPITLPRKLEEDESFPPEGRVIELAPEDFNRMLRALNPHLEDSLLPLKPIPSSRGPATVQPSRKGGKLTSQAPTRRPKSSKAPRKPDPWYTLPCFSGKLYDPLRDGLLTSRTMASVADFHDFKVPRKTRGCC